MANNNNINRSWISSSSSVGSRDRHHDDDDDGQSMDSFPRDQLSMSLNSSTNGSFLSGGGGRHVRSRGGDRYNHYRKDPPTKVKPWMRDKAITGTTTGSNGSSTKKRVHRFFAGNTSFGRSNSHNNNNNNSGIYTNQSFSNSIAEETVDSLEESNIHHNHNSSSCANSVSSASSFPESTTPRQHLLPREITSTTASTSSTYALHHHHNTTTETDEDEKIIVRNLTHEYELQETEVSAITTDVTMQQLVSNNAETEKVESSSKSLDQTHEKEELSFNISSNNTAPEAPLEANDDKPQENNSANVDGDHSQNSSTADEEKKVEEQATLFNIDDQPLSHDSETPTANNLMTQSQPSMVESARSFSFDKNEDEVYDSLLSVQPSSYNPMGFTTSSSSATKPQPAASAFAKLEKPTPLATEQKALLQNAIMEEEASEEESVDEAEEEKQKNDDDKQHQQETPNIDVNVHVEQDEDDDDELVGNSIPLDPLNTTQESNATEFISLPDDTDHDHDAWEQASPDLNIQTVPTDENDSSFHLMWPEIVSPSTLADVPFPDDWEQQQTLAVGATITWIGQRRRQSADRDEQQKDYSEFVAALANCPALTTAFLAEKINDNNWQCFCPCSRHMSKWRLYQSLQMEESLFADIIKCPNEQFTPDELLRHLESVRNTCGDPESRYLHAIVLHFLTSLFGESHPAFGAIGDVGAVSPTASEEEPVAQETLHQETPVKSVSIPPERIAELNQVWEDIKRLKETNAELTEKLCLAEEQQKGYEAKNIESAALSSKQTEELKELRSSIAMTEKMNAELQEKLASVEELAKDEQTKNADAATVVAEKDAELSKANDTVKELEETNTSLAEKLRVVEEALKVQTSKSADAVASSEAQADMMKGLCDELKRLEETNAELKQKLEASEELVKMQEAKSVAASAANSDSNEKIRVLNEDVKHLGETNADLMQKLAQAEEREKQRASEEENITLVHVGDMPVDVGRLRVQCQKYFQRLRIVQLKSHCIRDKSSVKLSVEYNPTERRAIDIQAILDQGAAIPSQDTTYLFRELDTFNKGHFHTHKLLIPWSVVAKDGKNVTRSAFFAQFWQQLGSLKISLKEKNAEIPLFQESKGQLIPMPNAVLEGMLRCTPAELDRIFAARIAPYYRAIGRAMVQCVAATTDDDSDPMLKIAGSAMPLILRQKLFRGVEPIDESYPLNQLLDHAFSLLGMENMTREKALEYFSIDMREYPDVRSTMKKVREEVQEMWIKERSLTIKALEEGLTLNGLADMSFCCGLVPLEAVNEILFAD